MNRLVKRSVLCGTLQPGTGLVLRFQLSLYSQAPSFDILSPFCRRSFLPLDMAPLHQYSELPGEEKLEGEKHQSLPKSRKWSPLSLLLLIPLLFVASLVFVVGLAKIISQPIPPSQIGSSRWLAHEARQTDAQYLLGVGKADITGYVNGRRGTCSLLMANTLHRPVVELNFMVRFFYSFTQIYGVVKILNP
jgi:hypothetical protein